MMLAVILMMSAGCSKSGNDDNSSLLRTIPADASSVVLLNLEETLESLGCKTDGSTITLSADLKKGVDESNSISGENKKIFHDICDGKTGVSITSLAFFSAARSYVTGLLNDPDKFVGYALKLQENPSDSLPPVEVREENGIRIVGKQTVVIGNQFWICTEGTPDTEQLKYYQSLNENQSFISNKTAPLLLEEGKVVTYVADVKRTFDRIPESTYYRMASGLMFDDMSYVAGTAHFDKKRLVSSSKVLNSKMQPADLNLPTEKIDASVVGQLGKNGDVFIAAGIPEKLSKKIADGLSNAFGSNAGALIDPLRQIDGTVAICMDMNPGSALALVSTTGKDFASLSNVLQMLPGVSVTRDGDMLTVRYGQAGVTTAELTAEEAASRLKGAWIGMMSSDLPGKGMNTVARLVPDNKSVRLEVEIDGGLDALMTALLR